MLKIKTLVWVSLFVSIIVSSFVGYAALDHNPMGEFCAPVSDTQCKIVWGNFSPLLVSWFLVVFVVVVIFLSVIRYGYYKIANKGN